jgi:hypothetical protein
MTTREINEKFDKLTKELNKVKTYNTRLAKKLTDEGIKVPTPNWKESDEKKTND